MDLHYQEYGDHKAPLLVFLHGGGTSSWMWDQQIQYLTKYHCVTVDLPEQGQNRNKGNFSIKDRAGQINELIDQLSNGKTVAVIGFSLGAQVLVQMLSDRSDLIDYAIINSALVKPSKLGEKVISPFVRLTFPLIKNRAFSKLQAKTLFIGEKYFEKYYEETCQMEGNTLIRILKENLSFQLPRKFKEAKAKILVTVGEKEKTMMKKSVSDLVKSNENCKGVMIAGLGHGLPLAKPHLCRQIIEKWINDQALPEECQAID